MPTFMRLVAFVTAVFAVAAMYRNDLPWATFHLVSFFGLGISATLIDLSKGR